MKLKLLLLFVISSAILFAGCSGGSGGTDKTAYEKIQKQLVNLETYKSEATVEYKSNKGSNVYDTVQQCTVDGKYRIEVVGPENVAGNVTIYNGETIYQYNPKISGKVSVGTKENPERSEIFLTSFIKNYLVSNEVSVSVGNFGQSSFIVLEAIVPGNHPYLASEKLWVDNKTLNPIKLVVYDQDGSERIVVNYKKFEYNVPLDEKLFTI